MNASTDRISACRNLRRTVTGGAALCAAAILTACAAESGQSEARAGYEAEDDPQLRIVRLLRDGDAVFGIFSGEHTPEGGAAMAETRNTDFVFYSLESGPFDIPAMVAYADAMAEAAGDRGTHPLMLRIPPIRDGEEEARARVREGLAAAVAGIVLPHVESGGDAAVAVEALGSNQWPGRADGAHVGMLIVEDQVGVEHVDDITSTPGVGVVFAGPGDLRRAYEGDMEAVEAAIQTVLASCKRAGVPCGITAGADDIAERLEQGFRVIIVTEPEALAVGMAAAGRVG